MPRLLCAMVLMFGLGTAFAADPPMVTPEPMAFWDTPQYGANSFNRLPPDLAYYQALKAYGATWVRLSYDKWQPAQRDFLMGSADHYQGLMPADLATLRANLDLIHRAGLKAVIAPLSLPGSRWSQNNFNKFDDRLWQDKRWWQQSARFWRDLAVALKDHPAVIGYNLINEPAPEKPSDLDEHASTAQMQQWYARERGGSRDLLAFYTQVLQAIREVDPHMPVMLDAGWYAAADGFAYWPAPLADERVLYSVHMYEPYAATSAPNARRQVPYGYPGKVPYAGQVQYWDSAEVSRYLLLPFQWAAGHGVPAARMVVGEFGCIRQLAGCPRYLEDVLQVLDQTGAHWAFYSFREDAWDAMDYELGTVKVPWAYWQAAEAGTRDPIKRSPTPLFEPIRKRLGGNGSGNGDIAASRASAPDA